MFTRILNIQAANLLKSVHFLNECALFMTTQPAEHYNSLTLQPTYILAMSPDKSSKTLPRNTSTNPKTIEAPWFVSGWLGVINYPNFQTTKHCDFLHFRNSILIDPLSNTCTLQSPKTISSAELHSITSELEQAISNAQSSTASLTPKHRPWTQQWSKAQYTTAFNSVKDYLASGDAYQVNLAMPFICNDDITNTSPYQLLTTFNGRHACYLKLKDRTIFSVSPERLIQINGQKLITSPIKGTAPRSEDKLQDSTNAKELTASTKNQAENLMIVDLLRNDLSMNALPHSVKVEKLFELESHHNVHHLVSTISATLKQSTELAGAIRDIFPGGSITGAPKKRAMEIIEELEAQPRGAYCGSFGYIDDRGLCDFNILIRTIEAKKDGAVCWGGGGIVMDSDCDSEYQEIFNKVKQILDMPM